MAHNGGGATSGGNREPRIRSFRLADGPVLDRAAPAQAILDAGDPDGDPVAVTWRVLSESTDRRKAGDAEAVPPDHSGALRHADSHTARIEGLPAGDYRSEEHTSELQSLMRIPYADLRLKTTIKP